MADITSADFKQLITAITESNAEILAEQAKTTQKIEENTRESLRSSGDLAGFDRREEQKQRDEEAARAEEQAAAEAEAARIAAEKAERNGTFLGKITNFFSKPDAADEEDKDKAAAKDSKMLGYLKSTAGFLGGIAKGAAEKVKGGFKGIGKFLFGAMLVGILAFLNSPKFEEIKNTLIDVVVPALTYLYEEIIKPLALYIGGKLNDLFEDLKSYVDGDKGIGSVLTENIEILSAIVLALAPGLITKPLFGAVTLFAGAMKKSYLAQLATNAAAGAGGKAGILGTLKALGTTFLKFAGIGALIYAAVVGIFQGSKDAFAEYDKTGSIWESIKTFLVSFLANAVGALLNPIKDGISWVYNAIGEALGIESLKNLSKDLDDIDIVEGIKKMLIFLGDFISDFFKKSIDKIKNVGSNILSGAKNLFNKVIGDDETPETEFAKKRRLIMEAKEKGSDDPNKLYKNGRLVTDPEEKRQIYEEQEEVKRNLRKRRNQRSREKAEEKLQNQKQFGASSAGLTDPRALAGPMPSQAAPIVVNAPATTNVNAPNTTNMSSASTPMINSDRVFDKLSAVP